MPTVGNFPGANPLSELRTDKLRMAKGEYVAVGAGAEQDLLNVTGPGCVESLWMATAGPSASLDARIRVYYDGSATPSIDMDIGTLLALHYGAGSATGVHETSHVNAQINSINYNTGWMLRFPMPFGTSIRITYLNGGGAIPATPGIYWMAAYSLFASDRANGLRLRGTGVRQPNAVAVAAAATYQLANLTGGPGALVWHSYIGGFATATNLTWLERNFALTIDGEGSPSIVSSGTEDWFDSAWYYNGWRDFSAGMHSYVATDLPAGWPYCVGQATDLLSKWGGIPFNNSLVMTLQTEAVCTTGHTFCYSLLYYM